jgi:maltooligosyltrehalose trehalohydrolase
MVSASHPAHSAGRAQKLKCGAVASDEGIHYHVWAPTAPYVYVEIYDAEEIVRRLPLTRYDGGYFGACDSLGAVGDRYKFWLAGRGSFPDPASRWQPNVHGPSVVVDPRAFQWRCENFRRPAFRDLVIYELHVGTFTPAGTFRGVCERLDYLSQLGINAIELMPIATFPGKRNWGYDGVYPYAPCTAYGQPDDLRAMIDAAHDHGIAVILDVVYNHFGPDGNYLGHFIGDYLDEDAKTPWGGSIRFGFPEMCGLREFVIQNVSYWMEDFRIDGFRLDATHAIVDDSPRHILTEITEAIHANGGYAIAEDSRNDRKLLQPASAGGYGFDAVWADDFHHTIRVALTGERHSYFADFDGSTKELVSVVRNGWHYMGQFSKHSGGPRGTPTEGLHLGTCVHCISNHDQVGNRAFGERLSMSSSPEAYRAASALLCLSPHTPMLFMGQEWGATTPFLYFTDHAGELGRLVSEGRAKEFAEAFSSVEMLGKRPPDPQDPATFVASRLNWNERTAPHHTGIECLYRACLEIRRSHSSFRPRETAIYWAKDLPEQVIVLGLSSKECAWVLIVDLTGGHDVELEGLPTNLSAKNWARVLSTREIRFGGDGCTALSESFESLHFDRPEAILLRRVAP